MNDVSITTRETNLDAPMRVKAVKEIRLKVYGAPGGAVVGTVKLYADRVLVFTGNLTTHATAPYKLNLFPLPSVCRGESFYMVITGAAATAMQVQDAKITNFTVEPSGAVI